MAGQQQSKNIQSKTLLEVDRAVNEQRGTTTIIRVVDWITDAGKHYPQLEKREFFTDTETGEMKMGKAKGMTAKDLLKVQDAWGEIMAALGGKAAAPQTQPAPAAKAAPATAPAESAPPLEDF